ncbi:MAG TPA: SAM-dependent chlorinase/fluorinase [Bacteroidia bacterium]|nr:SAM-dependent chlorinase/fluorinase [Bacteroidia bacterium]
MPVITITTDWGSTDYFVGAMKGDLLSLCPGVTMIDISHSVKPFDMVQGAFIFKNSWERFPKGTVHLIGMCSASNESPVMVALHYQGHFFVGPDDGFFSLVFEELPSDAYFILDAHGKKVHPDSRALASSGAFLAKGGKLEEMGSKAGSMIQKSMIQPVIEEFIIRGTIIYIDTFGNLVTNIERHLFERISKGRDFDITLRTREYVINEIHDSYFTAGRGNLLAHYNESGYLEIAISQGDASKLIGLNCGDIIRIEFK